MNSFGTLFRISIYGESHGPGLGILIDGCPAGLTLTTEDFYEDLSRRKTGTKGTSPRTETDHPTIHSGVFNSKTTGAPILIAFENTNTHSHDYENLKDTPRPGHADFTANQKFGSFNDYRGGGHFSGRLTLGLVTAGTIAKKIILPMSIHAQLIEAGGNPNIQQAIDQAIQNNDSIGGIIQCTVDHVFPCLGEPFFDSIESLISHMMFSIPAVKAIEFGSGFSAARMTGSQHNDPFINRQGKTTTNFSSGINGGITNGNSINFKLAIKPTSSIGKTQHTFNFKKNEMVDLSITGRHDTCIALRTPVIVENATAIVLADFMLREQKIKRIL